MAQDRKVFVGGVPQDLNHEDLFAIFSEYAGVKKAWLQNCRATEERDNDNSSQNHRGFGFVIFHDANAIEELLGNNPSRFVVLRSGAKLEVKRALSSTKMSGPSSWQQGPVIASVPPLATPVPTASLSVTDLANVPARPPGRVTRRARAGGIGAPHEQQQTASRQNYGTGQDQNASSRQWHTSVPPRPELPLGRCGLSLGDCAEALGAPALQKLSGVAPWTDLEADGARGWRIGATGPDRGEVLRSLPRGERPQGSALSDELLAAALDELIGRSAIQQRKDALQRVIW